MLSGLASNFLTTVQQDDRISPEVAAQVGDAAETGIDFVSSTDVEAAAQAEGLDAATTAAVVEDYETAQIQALKVGLLAAALIALASLASTRHLPASAQTAEGESEARSSPEEPATAAA